MIDHTPAGQQGWFSPAETGSWSWNLVKHKYLFFVTNNVRGNSQNYFFNQYVNGLITFREPVQLDLTRGEALPGIVIVTHNIDNQIDCHIITLRGQGFHQIAKKNSTETTAWQFLSSHLGATGSGISPGLGVVNTRPARWPARFPSRRCFCKPSQYQYQDPITSSFKLTVWCEESWGLTKTDWGWRSS